MATKYIAYSRHFDNGEFINYEAVRTDLIEKVFMEGAGDYGGVWIETKDGRYLIQCDVGQNSRQLFWKIMHYIEGRGYCPGCLNLTHNNPGFTDNKPL